MARLPLPTLLLAAALAACAGKFAGPRPAAAIEAGEEWRDLALSADSTVIDSLPRLWADALAEARAKGFSRRLRGAGAALDPAAGLARAAPAPGPYRCRHYRVGAAFSVSREGFCFVGLADGALSLTTALTARRVGGHLWESDDGRRAVFLGAAIPRGSDTAPAYGDTGTASAVGLLERVGEMRYRLALAAPPESKTIEVIELVPAPPAL